MVLTMLLWQGVFVELVESHDDMGHCEDDEGADCPCGPNCHCCLECAHHGSPAIPFAVAPGADRILDFVEIGEFVASTVLQSTDRGPPLKVPKQARV